MSERIQNIFLTDFKHLNKVELFRKLLYILLLINAITLLPIAYDLFAYNGLVGTRGWNTEIPLHKQGTYALINVLSHPANASREWVYISFVVGQILFLITGLLKLLPKLSAFLVFFFTVNLFNKGYLAFTGGEVLVCFLLFYLMFIHKPKDEGGPFGDLQNILNNAFYRLLLFQVCILYLMSALYKFFDPDWISGHAVMYISRIDTFDSYGGSLFENSYVLSALATYLALAYQVLFPILVWFKKIKIPFLMFGVLFHLGIAFGMGLFTFGMIMILSYLLFLDDSHIELMRTKLRRKKATGNASL